METLLANFGDPTGYSSVSAYQLLFLELTRAVAASLDLRCTRLSRMNAEYRSCNTSIHKSINHEATLCYFFSQSDSPRRYSKERESKSDVAIRFGTLSHGKSRRDDPNLAREDLQQLSGLLPKQNSAWNLFDLKLRVIAKSAMHHGQNLAWNGHPLLAISWKT